MTLRVVIVVLAALTNPTGVQRVTFALGVQPPGTHRPRGPGLLVS